MKGITKLMFDEFKIAEVGMDFMGFKLNKNDIMTYHHLIIPKRNGGLVTRNNGALIQRVPHDYLNIIEMIDPVRFAYITSEMIDINVKGFIDPYNIANIHAILDEFEAQHEGETTRKGKLLIKREYKQGRAVL